MNSNYTKIDWNTRVAGWKRSADKLACTHVNPWDRGRIICVDCANKIIEEENA